MRENKIIISVIIPVFNAELYLEKCVNSIINQTFKNFELILIDDGSLDSSKDLVKNFAEKYIFVKAFYKEHKGVSCARNKGLEVAKGEYIIFIDSDDYVNSCMNEIKRSYIYKFNVTNFTKLIEKEDDVAFYFIFITHRDMIYKNEFNSMSQSELENYIESKYLYNLQKIFSCIFK